jgi:hypothetical protein
MRDRQWAAVFLPLLASCYHYSIAGNQRGDVESTRVTTFWGIVDDETPLPPPQTLSSYCAANPGSFSCDQCTSGIHAVKITNNYLYSLINVVSLGFINLTEISYKCYPTTGNGGFPALDGGSGP